MEYNYTYDVIEKILLKKSLTDKKYLGIMADNFDQRWFEGSNVNVAIMKLAILYMKKNNKVPTSNTIKLMAKKYCEKRQDIKIEDVESRLLELKSFEIPDDEMTNKNLEMYIKEKGYYFAISDNIATITSNGDISKCMDRFDKINKIMFRDDNMGLNYFSKEGQNSFWDYVSNPEVKISTGWKNLDINTNGGFLKDGRMLALFCAQPGLGKSLFLANIAVNFLAQEKSVVVISLEMSENVYCSRFASIISEDNVNKLKSTMSHSKEKIEKFYKAHPNANLIVKEYPPSSVRVVDVERYLEKLKENGTKIDVIVIDYLNLLLPNTKEEGMYRMIKAVSEQLRSLSYKFNAPVISATQVNRDGTNNPDVNLTNISESSGQSATADWIGILWRGDDDLRNGVINMNIVKNRFGEPGKTLQFHMNPTNLKVTDVAYTPSSSSDSEADRITSNLTSIQDDLDNL